MKIYLLLILFCIALSSCYSYKIFPREYRGFSYAGERKKAFVENPAMSKEYRILKKAGIFRIIDSTNITAARIVLHPFEKSFSCGEPILGSVLTLGQLPIYLPDRYQYSFDEITSTDTLHRRYEIEIATRVWFWDLFAFRKKFDQKAGQVLLAKYYGRETGLPD